MIKVSLTDLPRVSRLLEFLSSRILEKTFTLTHSTVMFTLTQQIYVRVCEHLRTLTFLAGKNWHRYLPTVLREDLVELLGNLVATLYTPMMILP